MVEGAIGPPTLDALCERITAESFTMLHLVCHGRFEKKSGETILYFGRKDQSFSEGILLADSKTVPYALAVADLNNDKKADIIVGHIEAPSTVLFNDGSGRNFTSISFGDSKGTVYGFAVGDFNEDGTPDIAAARSEGPNVLYFGNIKSKNHK